MMRPESNEDGWEIGRYHACREDSSQRPEAVDGVREAVAKAAPGSPWSLEHDGEWVRCLEPGRMERSGLRGSIHRKSWRADTPVANELDYVSVLFQTR
jgi:hypothetical protein